MQRRVVSLSGLGLFAAVLLALCDCSLRHDGGSPPAGRADFPAPVQPAPPPDGLFNPGHPLGITAGVGTLPQRLLRDYDMEEWPQELRGDVQRLQGAGARWYRIHSDHFPAFHQRALERDDYGYEHRDELVRELQAAGVDILMVIGRTNGIASCRQFSKQLPAQYLPSGEDEESYRAYVATIVERYDGDGVDDMPGLLAPIRWYQLGNENDLHYRECRRVGRDYATPAQYLALAAMTSQAMDQASGQARLAASMTFGHVTEPATGWTEELLGLDGGAIFQHIDALDLHDYSADLTIQRQQIEQLSGLAAGRAPIWITETSVPGDPAARAGWDEQRQGRALVGMVCQALAAGVERLMWHTLTDAPPMDSNRWRDFGSNALYACIDPVVPVGGRPPRCSGFEIKLAGRAFAAMSDALEGWTAVEQLPAGEGYRLQRRQRGDALVLEPAAGPVDVAPLLGAERVVARDLLTGESAEVLAAEVVVGDNPMLVESATRE